MMRESSAWCAVLLALGCGGSSSKTPDAAPDAAEPPPPPPALLQACTDAIADVYTLPDNLPPYDASHRGDVIRCGYDHYLSATDINKSMTAYGYLGPKLTSGAWLFRIAYRTERIAAAGSNT